MVIDNSATPFRLGAVTVAASGEDDEEDWPMPKGSPNDGNIPDWSISPFSSPIPAVVGLNLPCAEEFSILADLSNESLTINGRNYQPVDLD